MGGWMTYQRFRHRNGLMQRPVAPDQPYTFEPGVAEAFQSRHQERNDYLLNGDLNRMERDYLEPDFPERPFASRDRGSDPAAEVAAHTGVDVETVRKVLRYVFFEQR